MNVRMMGKKDRTMCYLSVVVVDEANTVDAGWVVGEKAWDGRIESL